MINSIGPGLLQFPTGVNGLTGQSSPKNGSFGDALTAAFSSVDSLQAGADAQVANLLQGAPNTDTATAMISVEKADIAFQLMMQVRNKVVSAYQDIEKMQF